MPSVRTAIAVATLAIFTVTPLSLGVSAFDLPQHRALTEEVLAAVRVTIQGRVRGFSDLAIKQIRQSNEGTDALSTAAYFDPERHFTNEAFSAGTEHLLRLKRSVLENVRLARRNRCRRGSWGRPCTACGSMRTPTGWAGRSGIELFGAAFSRTLKRACVPIRSVDWG